jgi:hypothetical protein
VTYTICLLCKYRVENLNLENNAVEASALSNIFQMTNLGTSNQRELRFCCGCLEDRPMV